MKTDLVNLRSLLLATGLSIGAMLGFIALQPATAKAASASDFNVGSDAMNESDALDIRRRPQPRQRYVQPYQEDGFEPGVYSTQPQYYPQPQYVQPQVYGNPYPYQRRGYGYGYGRGQGYQGPDGRFEDQTRH